LLGGIACEVAAKAKVPFADRHEIELKIISGGKIKNTEALTKSLGLLIVRLIYVLYVGHP